MRQPPPHSALNLWWRWSACPAARLPDFPFCERIRRVHLSPLQREQRQGVVQLDLGAATPVT